MNEHNVTLSLRPRSEAKSMCRRNGALLEYPIPPTLTPTPTHFGTSVHWPVEQTVHLPLLLQQVPQTIVWDLQHPPETIMWRKKVRYESPRMDREDQATSLDNSWKWIDGDKVVLYCICRLALFSLLRLWFTESVKRVLPSLRGRYESYCPKII